MNKVILMGRLTRDPDVRYSAGESGTSVARYTLAVDRRFNKRDGEATADFIIFLQDRQVFFLIFCNVSASQPNLTLKQNHDLIHIFRYYIPYG